MKVKKWLLIVTAAGLAAAAGILLPGCGAVKDLINIMSETESVDEGRGAGNNPGEAAVNGAPEEDDSGGAAVNGASEGDDSGGASGNGALEGEGFGGADENGAPGAADDRKQPLPASYDGRTAGRAPAIKNQGTLGTCWAFASLMALEARLLPEEQYDFSEDHISLNNGFCIPQEEGGEYTMSMAYLLSWKGPVMESDDPYGDGVSPDGLEAVKHVQGIEMVPAKDYEKIKRAILRYGGVQSSLYTSMTNEERRSIYYNEDQYSYCYLGSDPPNHDSVIIGWDDNYPKENFNVDVTGDGAFICMNSWGDNFGDNGYFYVSYYDSNIGMNNLIYTVVEDPDNYDHNYQTDLRGWVGQLGYGEDTVWFSNVYTAGGAESLEAAGFYATDRNTSYEIYVAQNVGDEEEIIGGNGFQDRKPAASGTVDYAGFYTIPLDMLAEEERLLLKGGRFAVIIKLTTPGSVHPAAIEYDAGDGKTVVDISDGEGYVSPDGIHFTRVESEQNCNVCLKAYMRNR